MTDGQHRLFTLLDGRHRVRLIDEAGELARRYPPSGCSSACSWACERCLEAQTAHLVQLMARDADLRRGR